MLGHYSADVDGYPLMAWRAYMDASGTKGTYALAGYIADIESWTMFAREWQNLLNAGLAGRAKGSGKPRFKMREMTNPKRIGNVPLFYKLIEDHVQSSISIRFNTVDWARARQRVCVPGLNLNWGFWGNPFQLAFRGLMDNVHHERERLQDVITPGQKIDFIFDEDKLEKHIGETWEEYLSNRPPGVREIYGAKPIFDSDEKFLPLQAADFWAWWVRRWCDEGTPEKITAVIPDFGTFKGTRDIPRADIVWDEEGLVVLIRALLRDGLGARPIYDVRFKG